MKSMTGYASLRGAGHGFEWVWDLRSVNGKGLDLRLRIPDWITGLEAATRKTLQAELARGSVQLGLRLTRDDSTSAAQLDMDQVQNLLAQSQQITDVAKSVGAQIAPLSVSDILQRCSQSDHVTSAEDVASLGATLQSELADLVGQLTQMRAAEGAALQQVLSDQIARFSTLLEDAQATLDSRAKDHADAFQNALERIGQDHTDPERLAQEIAILAVKNDVTEEVDRLAGHIAAAKALIADTVPVGRKFDFLMQEFNREVNTLCAKSSNLALTNIGLDMKLCVDQMREQIQNVE